MGLILHDSPMDSNSLGVCGIMPLRIVLHLESLLSFSSRSRVCGYVDNFGQNHAIRRVNPHIWRRTPVLALYLAVTRVRYPKKLSTQIVDNLAVIHSYPQSLFGAKMSVLSPDHHIWGSACAKPLPVGVVGFCGIKSYPQVIHTYPQVIHIQSTGLSTFISSNFLVCSTFVGES